MREGHVALLRRHEISGAAGNTIRPALGLFRVGERLASAGSRTPRPNLDERTKEHSPPKDARVCSCYGKPYVANGERSTTIIEIEVRAHTRKIVRPQ